MSKQGEKMDLDLAPLSLHTFFFQSYPLKAWHSQELCGWSELDSWNSLYQDVQFWAEELKDRINSFLSLLGWTFFIILLFYSSLENSTTPLLFTQHFLLVFTQHFLQLQMVKRVIFLSLKHIITIGPSTISPLSIHSFLYPFIFTI